MTAVFVLGLAALFFAVWFSLTEHRDDWTGREVERDG